MENRKKNFNLIVTLLYFIISLPGFSILFIFPPRKLLFNKNDKNYENKIYLFKNFVKNIYENINKPFIQNISLIDENRNEKCNDDEKLIIEHQHYGNFSNFYGKGIKFCIKRNNNTKYNYEKLLKSEEDEMECKDGKIACATLNRKLNLSLCMEAENCPLNYFDFGKSGSFHYNYPFGESSFCAGYDPKRPIIIDIDIINNSRFCLERFNFSNDLKCEFPDNNKCFIQSGAEEIVNQVLKEDYKLTPINLAKWNLENNSNINHNFCNGDTIYFHIFAVGYINFTYDNLKEFQKEFPSTHETNNSLYNTCEAFKTQKNFDIFFYLLSFILLCWSITHFILQILFSFEIKNIRNYYIYNGKVLFFFKLISYFVMIIYHYYFYLKIKKVYLILIDEPTNQILNIYKSTRNIFIIKIISFWIIGLIIISIDLIILSLNSTFQIEVDNKKKSEEINIEKNPSSNIINEQKEKNEEDNIKPPIPPINNPYIKTIEETNTFLNFDKININFVCKENLSKPFPIEALKSELFYKIVEELKDKYIELKDKDMKVFIYESSIINKNKTVEDNGILDNMRIVIMS